MTAPYPNNPVMAIELGQFLARAQHVPFFREQFELDYHNSWNRDDASRAAFVEWLIAHCWFDDPFASSEPELAPGLATVLARKPSDIDGLPHSRASLAPHHLHLDSHEDNQHDHRGFVEVSKGISFLGI